MSSTSSLLLVLTAVLSGTLAALSVQVQPGVKTHLASELPKNITASLGLELVLVPVGTCRIGSPEDEAARGDDEGPQREIEITKPFYLGKCEVTQEEYQQVMGKNPSYFSPGGGGREQVHGLDTRRFPVESVTWDEALEFCRKLSSLDEERAAGRVYFLPTEAQWEYACRGGSRKYQVFDSGPALSAHQANFNGTLPYGGAGAGPYLERTTRVGSYQANAFGLHDLHGNVWEWCADWYDKDYHVRSGRTDPSGPSEGACRVLRGGAWIHSGKCCRSAYRDLGDPAGRLNYVGFRVACKVGATGSQ